MASTSKQIEQYIIQLPEFQLPLEVHMERRSSARVTLGKGKAILRMPLMISANQKEEHLIWAKNWVIKKLNEDRSFRQKYVPKDYRTGQLIQLRNREFILQVNVKDKLNNSTAKLMGNTVILNLTKTLDAFQMQKVCSTLISRTMSKVFHPEFSARVDQLNDLHFQKEINEIRFKFNHSNWGSCSSTGNLNFSSRLLLTPDFITDYIIIHELAHLVHLNHSNQFWGRVEKAMPDYRLAESWLKKNGEKCNW